MSYKVYKSLNYFVVHDNSTSTDVIRQVRDLVRWEKKGTLYSFYYNTPNLTTSGNSIIRLGTAFEFSDLQDITGTAWASQSVFDLYLEQWTGHICCNTAGEDAIYDLKNSAGTSLKTGAIPSGEISEIDIDDISFTDSNGTVSSVPAGVDIVATPCGIPAIIKTARLKKTGVTASLVQYDDGWFEDGRQTDWAVLDSPPTHANGSPTINTTTNRFTDILGGQTYALPIMLDWSTWDKTNLTAYKTTATNTSGGIVTACNTCNALSIGTFSSGWMLANTEHWNNILSRKLANPLGYSPMSAFIFTSSSLTSTPYTPFPNIYYWGVNSDGAIRPKDRNENSSCLAVRTMTLSTSNVLT